MLLDVISAGVDSKRKNDFCHSSRHAYQATSFKISHHPNPSNSRFPFIQHNRIGCHWNSICLLTSNLLAAMRAGFTPKPQPLCGHTFTQPLWVGCPEVSLLPRNVTHITVLFNQSLLNQLTTLPRNLSETMPLPTRGFSYTKHMPFGIYVLPRTNGPFPSPHLRPI